MKINKGFLLGLMLGGIVGSVAALLFAPKEGSEVREDIKRKARDVGAKATEVVESAKESARKAGARGRTILEEKKAHVREAVQAGRKAAGEKRAELKAQMSEEPKPNI